MQQSRRRESLVALAVLASTFVLIWVTAAPAATDEASDENARSQWRLVSPPL